VPPAPPAGHLGCSRCARRCSQTGMAAHKARWPHRVRDSTARQSRVPLRQRTSRARLCSWRRHRQPRSGAGAAIQQAVASNSFNGCGFGPTATMCSAHVSSLPHPFGFLPRRPRRIRAPSRFCGNGSESRAAALCGKTSGATSEDRRIFPQGVSSGIDDGPWEALRCADLLGWATSSRRGRPVHRSCQYAGLAGDTYVVLTEITASAVAGALIAGAALLLLVGLWHAFPAVVLLRRLSL